MALQPGILPAPDPNHRCDFYFILYKEFPNNQYMIPLKSLGS